MRVCLKCSTCGNDQFLTVDEENESYIDAQNETLMKCSDCGRIVSNETLIEENRHIIDANLEDFKRDIYKGVERELKKVLKKWK